MRYVVTSYDVIDDVLRRFFNKEEYQQLIFSAFMDSTKKIRLLKPAIMKPQTLWSGKQVLSRV